MPWRSNGKLYSFPLLSNVSFVESVSRKFCNSENNDDIEYALSGIMANILNYSVERIRPYHFINLLLKFCKDLSLTLAPGRGGGVLPYLT